MFSFVFLFFFFQAEDGIRDHCVTGVQTCALPISRARSPAVGLNSASFNLARVIGPALSGFMIAALGSGIRARSEERRVGKECGGRRAAGRRKGDTNSRDDALARRAHNNVE